MPSITVRDIPVDLYERLKASAETNRRSLNSEIIICIEKAIGSTVIDTEDVLRRARTLRELTSDYHLTDEALKEAKEGGRP